MGPDTKGSRSSTDLTPNRLQKNAELAEEIERRHTVEDEPSVLASIIDISTRKRLEEQLTANNIALRRSNAELEQFALIASHDLREPLRKVLSFSRLLQSGRYGHFDNQGDEFVGYIMEAAERMEALLDSLLRYSRVTSGAPPSSRSHWIQCSRPSRRTCS